MATLYSPKIVTNGLVLCLDAGNNKSYPGSGTTWNDLSGNNNTGSLVNGPTFTGSFGGSVAFDGVNDYVACPTSLLDNYLSGCTLPPQKFFVGKYFFIKKNFWGEGGSNVSYTSLLYKHLLYQMLVIVS